MQAYRDEGFPVTIVRPSMTYDWNLPIALGGWGTYTLADRLTMGRPIIVHGDGSSLWVVTHADDFARGFLGLLGNERALGQAFHITSDEVLTWNQIYQTIAEALGVEAKIVHIPSDFIARVAPQMAGSLFGDKTWSVVFDNSKIKSFVPGFEATVPFAGGHSSDAGMVRSRREPSAASTRPCTRKWIASSGHTLERPAEG